MEEATTDDIHLSFQCCIVAFLVLTESKLKNWTVKYGREEKVAAIMAQYKTFVSKNKIFQEFQKAFVEFREVCDEYRADGEVGPGESEAIEAFVADVDSRCVTRERERERLGLRRVLN